MILRIEGEKLDTLMPMHAVLGPDRRVLHAAPTLRKLAGPTEIAGRPFIEVFESGVARTPDAAAAHPQGTLSLRLRHGHRTRLRGFLLPLGDAADGQAILNLSFAVSELARLDSVALSLNDFAPNDMIVDMLYLMEAKSAVMSEAQKLISRLQGAANSAEELAVTDTLTGLRNRRALEQAMARFIDRSIPFALVQLDLDLFKAVNDTHGHAAGDSVLRHVAQALREQTRASDTVARVGGDEFVMLLAEQTDPQLIERIAARIIRQIEQPVPFNGKECRVSTSLGTTLSTRYAAPDADRMLADADKALYAAKAAGRGCHRFWSGDLGAPPDTAAPAKGHGHCRSGLGDGSGRRA